MKTNTIFPAFFISSVIALTACTPRDVKLPNDPALGRFANGGNNRGQGGGDGFSLGNFAMASFLAEKHIEALELVQTATGKNNAAKSVFKVELLPAKDDSDKTSMTINTTKDSKLSYSSGSGSWNEEYNKKLTGFYLTSDPFQAVEITMTPQKDPKFNNLYTKGDSGKKGIYVNLKETEYNVVLQPVENHPDQVKIGLASKGEIIGAKGGKAEVEPFTVLVQLLVDKASLETSEVVIINAISKVEFPGPGTKVYSVIMNADNIKVSLEGFCNKMNGTFKAQAGPVNKFPVSFSDNEISINGEKWKSALADCGSRPTVDLGRLHIY